MKDIILKLIVIFTCLSIWIKAYPAVNLLEVYQDALENDPVFQAAYLTYLSRSENVPIARSDLLTSLIFFGSFNRVNSDLRRPRPALRNNFFQQFYSLTISQPLFNYAAWKQLKNVKAQVKAEYAILNGAAQDLIFRTAQAYFAILEAEDILRFTRAKKSANYGLLQQASKRHEAGLTGITTAYEAQAGYDQSIALEINAENDVINKQVALRQLTRHLYTDLVSIKGEFPLVLPEPNDVNAWVDTALNQNYNIQAAKYNVDAAQENIDVQHAGNSPRLDAIANYNFFDSNNVPVILNGSLALTGQPTDVRIRSQQFSVGLLAVAPLFQGGRVSAKTRQARYDHEMAKADLVYTHRQAVINTRQSYNNIVTSINRIKAERQAIRSARTSLESVDVLFRVGIRTIVDVLVSQQNLFNAQLDYTTNIYSYILATLQLKYATGTLSVEDILQINGWLGDSLQSLPGESMIYQN